MGTLRQDIMVLLTEHEMSARDLSQAIGITEREVYAHLPHVARTAKGRGKKLSMTPPRCLGCGYVFDDRSRLTRPGRCPKCKGTHLAVPTYRILPQG